MDVPAVDRSRRADRHQLRGRHARRLAWRGTAYECHGVLHDWENIPVAQYIVTKYWDTDGNGFADSQIDITGDGVNDLNYFANLLGTSVQKAEVKG